MTTWIRFELEALRDIAAAVRFYEHERRGLGTDFRRAVERAADDMRRFPDAGAPVRLAKDVGVRRREGELLDEVAAGLIEDGTPPVDFERSDLGGVSDGEAPMAATTLRVHMDRIARTP